MRIFCTIVCLLAFLTFLGAYGEPALKDNDYVIEKFVVGLESPTTIAFEGNDILALQKADGKVRLVRNGILQETPVLDENVTNEGEQGMLGITTVGTKVYLYFTESTHDGGKPLGKRVYSYDWNGQRLVNKTLVKDLWATQTYHNGGAMVTDKKDSVYLVVGDAGRYGKLQNHPTGEPDDTSVILRISPSGPYYAIGIRNSFGLVVDPVTNALWDTENGPTDYDEINMVTPNFNSGWDVIMGPANKDDLEKLPGFSGYIYHDPKFSWEQPVAPTGLSFLSSNKFGYRSDSLFAGDCNFGNLYRFTLNQNRDGFVFNSAQFSDLVVNKDDKLDEIIFGTGFGCIADVVTGPDGLLYVVSLSDGIIYRIMPKHIFGLDIESFVAYVIVPSVIAAAIIGLWYRRKFS
ncbi:MAG: PQQ-dependent sugar dehydrogenase [Thaumarchaeota archaeon]|nr:PQQ-dependent sugar dehydrogenase [Nitrososphaerota archaeon]